MPHVPVVGPTLVRTALANGCMTQMQMKIKTQSGQQVGSPLILARQTGLSGASTHLKSVKRGQVNISIILQNDIKKHNRLNNSFNLHAIHMQMHATGGLNS